MAHTTPLWLAGWFWRGALVALSVLGLAQGARANPMLLVEADTGRVIDQQDAGVPWYPASVTKLMTVYVALNAVKQGRLTLDTPLTVSARAAAQQPSKMGFKPGTQVTLDNALKMVMVKSANDMAVVVAEGVGGGSYDKFVAEMNGTARYLGMTGTHYENPNGLPDPDQVTTARDLALLARAIIYHFPEHEMLFRIPAIRIGKRVLRNYNKLIDRYPGADGMKTGFICASGFNLVASATRGNKRLIAVVLGAESAVARTEEAAVLFEKGFSSTTSWSIFGAAAPSLTAIQNVAGAPTDMRGVVCSRKRAVVAAENEDETAAGQGEGGAPFALAPPALRPGQALLQVLPPSMPPVPVFAGTKAAPIDPDAAVATAAPAKKGKKTPGPQVATGTTGTDAAAAKPSAKPGAKPAAKPAPKPKPAAVAAAPADPKVSDPKASDAAAGASTPSSAKKKVTPATPVTAGAAAKPKPKPPAGAAPIPPPKPAG